LDYIASQVSSAVKKFQYLLLYSSVANLTH